MNKLKTFFNRVIYKLKWNQLKKDQEAALYLSFFYLEKNKGKYAKAQDEVEALLLCGITKRGGLIKITLGRPGLLIGLKGSNIENLIQFYKKQYPKEKIRLRLKEDRIVSFAIPSIYDTDITEE